MEFECNRISKMILTAVRASVAQRMSKRYKYKQQEIAMILGIAQVAVSKYLNCKYSKSVAEIKEMIDSGSLDGEVIGYALKDDSLMVSKAIDELCAKIAASTHIRMNV